jgi:hypothetical protein
LRSHAIKTALNKDVRTTSHLAVETHDRALLDILKNFTYLDIPDYFGQTATQLDERLQVIEKSHPPTHAGM